MIWAPLFWTPPADDGAGLVLLRQGLDQSLVAELERVFLTVLAARPVSRATRASRVSDSCAPSVVEDVEDQFAGAVCLRVVRPDVEEVVDVLRGGAELDGERDRLGESGDVDGFDAERLRGAVEGAVAGDDLDVAEAFGSSSSAAIITTARGVSTQAVEPRMLSEGAAGAVLAGVADTDQEAVEVVGEPVERRDRVAYLAVVVRVAVADVVRDRVDDEQPDAAEVVRELP